MQKRKRDQVTKINPCHIITSSMKHDTQGSTHYLLYSIGLTNTKFSFRKGKEREKKNVLNSLCKIP